MFVRRKAGKKGTVMDREDMVKSLLKEGSEGGREDGCSCRYRPREI